MEDSNYDYLSFLLLLLNVQSFELFLKAVLLYLWPQNTLMRHDAACIVLHDALITHKLIGY